ncbi:hypothetical protein ElyMa_003515800 [Elysia marginata]|uniref:Smoothelin domain-containing protein n=1 Tax=Elysia marginata TaxID=1093978 RepID=A0AAV4EGL7_9GAST|nr:hypothetical protein ElyMa_003515800 [Elysia marginata]
MTENDLTKLSSFHTKSLSGSKGTNNGTVIGHPEPEGGDQDIVWSRELVASLVANGKKAEEGRDEQRKRLIERQIKGWLEIEKERQKDT